MNELSEVFSTLLGLTVSIESVRSIGGGCISEAARVCVLNADGTSEDYFVKANRVSFLENFQCEWDGLQRLGLANAIRVPRALAVGECRGRAWLVLEWIESSRPGDRFHERFGHQLAELHRATLGQRIGLERDNFLGAACQPNPISRDWVAFVAEHRIGYQLRWAKDQGLADSTLLRDGERITRAMAPLLEGSEIETSLLHGDLWSGNYLCDARGDAVVIDPAVYHGNREAEFGMLKLFGGCPERFYEAYDEAFPLAQGWQRRVNVYVLYHLLNHLNLFGRGYHQQCCRLAAEILRG